MKRFLLLLLIATLIMIGVTPLQAQEQPPSLTITDPNAIPAPMPMLDTQGYDIENFLLLGSDTTNPVDAGRTDVMVIVSVNRSAGTVSMLSIPRDLYVYIPGHMVYRINSAYGYGEHDGTGGFQLLAQTIRYNLGIEIDHYARVDFDAFKSIIDALGGVQISVDCAIQDYRLKQPNLDPNVADNWAMFTLPVGVYTMDGDLALWYARSRRTSSDFDRGRRHQALLRAIWQRIRSLNLVDQLSDIWPQVLQTVETDIQLKDMLDLVPLAVSLDPSKIASYTFQPNVETKSFVSPQGSDVLVPQRAAIQTLEAEMIEPPTEHQLVLENPRVEIDNASGAADLSQVASDRLVWEGFTPQISDTKLPYQSATQIYDYTGQSKGSSLSTLEAALRVSSGNVIVAPDANRTVDFRVVLGGSYSSCTYNVAQPSSN